MRKAMMASSIESVVILPTRRVILRDGRYTSSGRRRGTAISLRIVPGPQMVSIIFSETRPSHVVAEGFSVFSVFSVV